MNLVLISTLPRILLASIFLLFLLALTSCKTTGNRTESDTLGYMSGTLYVEESFKLFSSKPSVRGLADYIRKSGGRADDKSLTPEQLAKMIIDVSQCLEIDAFVMTGIIRKESMFNRTVRGVNGTGLTQMTSPALDEVNDQLGMRGSSNARPEAIAYFNNVLGKCIAPVSKRREWIPIWEASESDATENMKDVLIDDPLYAIVYGAIVLKVNLSNRKRLNSDKDLSTMEAMENLYRGALFDYNSVFEEYPDGVMRFAKEAAKNSTIDQN